MSPQKGKKGAGRPLGSKNRKPKLPAADVDESAVLTLHEVADYLHCHRGTVHKLIERGQIPCFRVGREWRFLKSNVDEWIAKGGGGRR
jgi:excisionase family DNA binding protein